MSLRSVSISDLVGKTIAAIDLLKHDTDTVKIVLTLVDGQRYEMSHDQNCCENVRVQDIVGDLNDLIGSPLVQAEESTNTEDPKPPGYDDYGSFTWTFYKFATSKGYVTIRWLGESNGYYSESVDLYAVDAEHS